MSSQVAQKRHWWHWYDPQDTPEERKLVMKLDLLIVPYAVIVYWVKYMDQTNINNAYVSGMSEDLDFHKNELVQFQTIYVVGAVVGMLPFGFLFPHVPMNWIIPGLDIGWGIFNLLQYRAQGFSELMAYRFMIGFFESAFFPGVHYVLGSWYRADEIARRGGVFYTGLTLGTLTAGLISAGTAANLTGHNGLAGWRWMFIITSIITLPVGLLGFLVWPGTPDKPNRRVLSQKDIDLAKARLRRNGNEIKPKPFSLALLKKIFTSWKIYILIIWDVFFWNSCINSSAGGFLLWLKSEKLLDGLPRFSVPQINNYGVIAPALGIFYILFINFGSDLFLGRAGAITLSHTVNIIGCIILIIWDVPESAKWFAFATIYSSVAMSSVLHGWANDILRHDVDERALTLIVMTAISQSTTAWTPLLVFKTVEAPRFLKGYSYVAANAIMLILFTQVVRYLHNRSEKQYALKNEGSGPASIQSEEESIPAVEDLKSPSLKQIDVKI